MPSVDWQPWHTPAFLEAQRRRRPVLLLLEAAWAPACAEAHRAVFARADVVQAIAETVVPVRVDVDRRPDIADRYGLGQWPSLLVLTPDGAVVTGGTRLDDTLAARLRQVASLIPAGPSATRHDPRRPDAGAPPSGPDGNGSHPLADHELAAAVLDALWQAGADADGVFRAEAGPCAVATLAALGHAAASGDGRWADAAATTIEALPRHLPEIDASGLVAAATPPSRAAVRLETQADWVRTLARAVSVEPDPAWSARLDRSVAALRREFRRPDGHWRPWVGASDLVLADASSRAIRALLVAADALQRPSLAEEAIEALEVLAPRVYVRAAGVSHVLLANQPRGPMLLDDAMLLAHALLDADAWRGDGVYRDLAEELRCSTFARLQDGSGGLQDRRASLAGAGQVGRLAEPVYPIAGNALAVTLCRRLAPGTLEREALPVLRAASLEACAAGVFAAPVVLAWEALGTSGEVMAAW